MQDAPPSNGKIWVETKKLMQSERSTRSLYNRFRKLKEKGIASGSKLNTQYIRFSEEEDIAIKAAFDKALKTKQCRGFTVTRFMEWVAAEVATACGEKSHEPGAYV